VPDYLSAGNISFAMLVVLASGQASAQQAAAADAGATVGRSWRIIPRISVSETFTDNVGLSSGTKQADQITEISPGIRIQTNTARLNAYVDYSLRNFIYARSPQANTSQNSLNAFGTLTAIDKWAFVDFGGQISQQSISAFGPQANSSGNINSNSTETSNYRISPHVRGRLANFADYALRYSLSETRTDSAQATSSKIDQFIATLSGTTSITSLSWALDANRQTSTFGSGVKSESDQIQARLKLRINPLFILTGSIGTETNNYATLAKESRATFGYGADWTPTERTQLSLFREHRFFGNGHTISFNHRMPLTAIRFTDSKSVVTSSPNTQASGPQGTYYDLLYSQLAASVPDPIQRSQQVLALLQQSGISPNATITNGFLAARVTVQRRQELSLVLNGLRNTATYTLFQSVVDSLGAATSGVDDFSTSPSVKQRGMSSNFSHRLSPLTALNAFSSWSRSEGASGGLNTTQRTFNVNVNTRISTRVSLSLGVRSIRAESTTTPYRENAVLGTLTAQY
jgi:uncharacterized protein (PEP-CTERM system associated)